jgi:polysaccharide biosynthesis protein PslH
MYLFQCFRDALDRFLVMPDHTGTLKSRVRCLWLTRVDPMHPDAGDLSYSFHLLKSLGRAGAIITVLTAARAETLSPRPTADSLEWILLPTRGRSALGSLFGRLPNVAARYRTGAFRRALQLQLAREWDAIIIDHLGMGWAWPWVCDYQRRRNPSLISVFIAHQCEADVRSSMARDFRGNPLRKIGLRVDAFKAGLLEREIVRNSTLFSVITPDDRHSFGNLPKSVLLTPGYTGTRVASRTINSRTPRRALIFGSARWLAKQMNLIDFITAADQLFWRNQIELWVVGKVSDRVLNGRHHRATRFLGFVDDPEPIFQDVRIGIVPERTGGGFKLKSLDYIFNRVPMAAIRGSVAGLPLTDDQEYLSFASIDELAQGVTAVIDDLERLNQLQEAAFAKCRAVFDWSERGSTLLAAIQAVESRQSAE